MKKLLSLVISLAVLAVLIPINIIRANTLTVTFNGNGGLFGEEEAVTVELENENECISQDLWPSSPVRSGYIFNGFVYNGEPVDSTFVFSEDTVIETSWIAKQTNITLNHTDGIGGDESCVATFDSDMPSITVPYLDGFDFIGYFDSEGKQYYGPDGNSVAIWDKDVETCELFASFEESGNGLLLGTPGYAHITALSNTYAYFMIYNDYIPLNTHIKFVDNKVVNYDNEEIYLELRVKDEYKDDVEIRGAYFGESEDSLNKITSETEDAYINSGDIIFDAYLNEIYNIWVGGLVITDKNADNFYYDGSLKFIKGENGEPHTLLIQAGLDGSEVYIPFLDITPDVIIKIDESVSMVEIGGIFASGNVTIYSPGDAEIYVDRHQLQFDGYYETVGISSNGTLTIDVNNKLTIDASFGAGGGSADYGIYTNNFVMKKGQLHVDAYTAGFKILNSFTMLSENSPEVRVYSHNSVAIKSLVPNFMTLNGAHVHGALDFDENADGVYCKGQSDVVITFAELEDQYDLWVAGIRVTAENKDDINNGQETLGSYDPYTKTLTIQGHIYSKDGYGIYALDDLIIDVTDPDWEGEGGGAVWITGYETAAQSTGDLYGIYCEGNLTIRSSDDSELDVSLSDSVSRNVAIFCDGRLTIESTVDATSGNVHNGDGYFAISAAVWARKGITINGNDCEKTYLDAFVNGSVERNDYSAYAILSGDGNPGFSEEATFVINHATVYAKCANNPNYSSYAIYSYGTITAIDSYVIADVEGCVADTAIVFTEDDLLLDDTIIYNDLEELPSGNENMVSVGLDVEGNIQANESQIYFESRIKWEDDYELPKVKKSYGIRTNSLMAYGENTDIEGDALCTSSGDSIGVYVKEQLSIDGGSIAGYGNEAVGDSIGIYCGRNDVSDYHLLNCEFVVGYACGSLEGESCGIRVKNGPIHIDSYDLYLVGKDHGLHSSSEIIFNRPSDYGPGYTFVHTTPGNSAVCSKEPLVLNGATILFGIDDYVPNETKELFTTNDGSVDEDGDSIDGILELVFKEIVDVRNVSMKFLDGGTAFAYGDSIEYTGTPKLYVKNTDEEYYESDYDKITYSYDYYGLEDGVYVIYSNVPSNIGKYKLVVTVNSDYVEGQQEIEFEIVPKVLMPSFNKLYFTYDGNQHTPLVSVDGIVGEDIVMFNSPGMYTFYDENGFEIDEPRDQGKYRVNIIYNGTIQVVDYDFNDVTYNYDLSNFTGVYETDFFILSHSTSGDSDDNAYSAVFNRSSQFSDVILKDISTRQAKKIFKYFDNFVEAIENGETIDLVATISNVSDKTVFSSKNVNDSNGIFFDITLKGYIENSNDEPVEIFDTNNQYLRIDVILNDASANKIIGKNREYTIYRLHNGSIDKVTYSLSKVDSGYKFTFYSDKFSTYAITYTDKKVIDYTDNYNQHKVPNTNFANE